MNHHDDTPNAHGSNDPGDPMLEAASQRLRQQAPDEVASRQALAQVKQRAGAPAPQRRSWWPALIGAGLATAAVIGVIAVRADDSDTLMPVQTTPEIGPPSTAPNAPEPTTTAVPSTTGPGPTGASLVVSGACITVTTSAGSATGCPQDSDLDHLEQRTFVADLDGPVLITSGSSDPFDDLTTVVDTGAFASNCQWDDLATRIPDGAIIELVVCNDTGVMGLTTVPDPGADYSVSYFTLPTPYLPGGTDLGVGTPIEGLPGALAFTAPSQSGAVCALLLRPDRSSWKEMCDYLDVRVRTALVELDLNQPNREGAIAPTIWEISVDETGLITSARVLDMMAPSSGCSINSANQLIQAMPESSIVMGIGCIDDAASLTTGSVLTQDGPPDGSIWLAQLDANGTWTITDNGTGIEADSSFPIVPQSVWEAWPESTVPGFRSYWSEPIVAIPTQPTVDAFADDVLTTLGTLGGDPEFPLNERLVDIQPAGLPLIIAQVELGGDDSVAGQVIYVWLDQEFDGSGPIGWRSGHVLAGEVCARGEAAGVDLCV